MSRHGSTEWTVPRVYASLDLPAPTRPASTHRRGSAQAAQRRWAPLLQWLAALIARRDDQPGRHRAPVIDDIGLTRPMPAVVD